MTFIYIFINFLLATNTNETISKAKFYKALASNDKIQIEELLSNLIKQKDTNLSQGYIATLKMSKSNFEKNIQIKISLFKEGATLLDQLILEYPKQIEFKFLRCIIQEKAPKILKYNTNIQSDKKQILSEFKNQSKSLQIHIINYAKNSDIFNEKEFKLK